VVFVRLDRDRGDASFASAARQKRSGIEAEGDGEDGVTGFAAAAPLPEGLRRPGLLPLNHAEHPP
jgi:hypothetical protein